MFLAPSSGMGLSPISHPPRTTLLQPEFLTTFPFILVFLLCIAKGRGVGANYNVISRGIEIERNSCETWQKVDQKLLVAGRRAARPSRRRGKLSGREKEQKMAGRVSEILEDIFKRGNENFTCIYGAESVAREKTSTPVVKRWKVVK
jgi:hypothetical protein